MPEGKELTPAEAYEKLERRAAFFSKFMWPCRIGLVFAVVGVLITLFTDQAIAAVGMSSMFVVLVMCLGQQEQYELLLKLLPKPGREAED